MAKSSTRKARPEARTDPSVPVTGTTRFGAYLRRKRQDAGFSQTRLAEALSVTHTYIHLLEKGRVDAPTELRCDQIAEALDLDVEEVRELARRERLARYAEKQGWDDPAVAGVGESSDLSEQEAALVRLVRSLDPDTRRDFEGMVTMLLRHRDEEEIRANLEVYVGSGAASSRPASPTAAPRAKGKRGRR